ncbi:hypothetical protein SCLCIDRAFT_686683 [Scleroderma citrinum Foug A]|uniref:Uncharacterized protein n=1 Tax=Scleroderma citrinum Foug A TaxID=1036808 RepID=A0A0C3D4P7_9AGAM|nr:hypothetical protein SCLCIDRAFT_686683 [Scleroderma citrinum Foug A]
MVRNIPCQSPCENSLTLSSPRCPAKPLGGATASSQAPAPETLITKSGRQVKMTKKAQELTHQNQIVGKKQMAPVTERRRKKNKKSAPAALVPTTVSDAAESQTSTKKIPTCGARKCNANDIVSARHPVSPAFMLDVPSNGDLLGTPSAAVYHTPNHGNKADLVSASAHGSKDPTCGQIMAQSTTYLKDGTDAAESNSNVPVLRGSERAATAPPSNDETETPSQAQGDHDECAACSGTALLKPLLPQASYRLLPVSSGSWSSAQALSSVFQPKGIRTSAEGVTHIDDVARSVVDGVGPVESTSNPSSAVGGVAAPVKSGHSSTDAPLVPSQSRTCQSPGLQANDRNKTLEVTLPSLVNQAGDKGDQSAASGSVSRAKLNDPTVDSDKRTGLKICIPPLRAGGTSGVPESPSQPSTSPSSTSSRRGRAPRARRGRGWSGSRGGGRIGSNAAPTFDLRPMTPASQKILISQIAMLPIGDVGDVSSRSRIGSLDMAQQGRCGDAPRSPTTVSSSGTQEVGGDPTVNDKNHRHLALHQGKKRKLDGSEG